MMNYLSMASLDFIFLKFSFTSFAALMVLMTEETMYAMTVIEIMAETAGMATSLEMNPIEDNIIKEATRKKHSATIPKNFKVFIKLPRKQNTP